MILWIDAQLSPHLAPWITERLGFQTTSVRRLGLRDAKDVEIFLAARQAGATIMTKDSDFRYLLDQMGPPPKILWITCGDTSNVHLRRVFLKALPEAVDLLNAGESLVEIGGD